MGTWAADAFGNDDSLDLVEALERSPAPAFLRTYLERALTKPANSISDYMVSVHALAAAELVAALRGKPNEGLPEECEEWVEEARADLDPVLAELALKALARIRSDSEVKRLWDESPGAAEWYEELDSLGKRLQDS